MTDLALRPAHALIAMMDAGETTSRELLDLYLERVERLNPALNAVVTLDPERARSRADDADAARRRGEIWGPLHGLPMTVKDCFETAGLRTTSGATTCADHVPTRDADAVERLLEAGAVLFGKTNLPEFAMDWQSSNAIFGTTNNPWDMSRTPGGSSGGSAAATAAGLTGLELGSDIGGSIRIPSHLCGIFGHKPSWGVVSQRGHIPGLPGSRIQTDINVIGPMARSADDLELALDVLAGPAPEHASAWTLRLPRPRRRSLADYRVAAWLDDPACPVDPRIRERLEATVEGLRSAGVRVADRAQPPAELAEMLRLYRRLLAPVTTVIMDDAQFASFEQLATSLPEEDEFAEFSRDAVATHHAWLVAHEARLALRERWADFFGEHDLLLCPVSPFIAIPHDHRQPMNTRTVMVAGRERSYLDQFAWMGPFGALGLPASVAPAGRTEEGLPVGIQIVGPPYGDRSTIDFARGLSAACGGFEAPPGT
ncbi:MAG: amidase [Myxococcota bacterium]